MKKLMIFICLIVSILLIVVPVTAGETVAESVPAVATAEAAADSLSPEMLEASEAEPGEDSAAAGALVGTEAAALVEDFPTVQAYIDEPVDEADIRKIVNAGINSPSGLNSQPWHFTVVTDKEVMAAIASEGDMSSSTRAGITQAPLAIVISCKKGSEFDAGLATQTMSVEAQLLGYGSKLFTSVRTTMNGAREQEFRKMLHIPEDMYACAVLIVGKQDLSVDAASTATGRYPAEQVVSYITP